MRNHLYLRTMKSFRRLTIASFLLGLAVMLSGCSYETRPPDASDGPGSVTSDGTLEDVCTYDCTNGGQHVTYTTSVVGACPFNNSVDLPSGTPIGGTIHFTCQLTAACHPTHGHSCD